MGKPKDVGVRKTPDDTGTKNGINVKTNIQTATEMCVLIKDFICDS